MTYTVKEFEEKFMTKKQVETSNKRVEKIISKHLNESIEQEKDLSYKIESVLDDYGILYGDVVEYDDKINLVGIDELEWDEARQAIKDELNLDVLLPSEDDGEPEDELVVLKESKAPEYSREEYCVLVNGDNWECYTTEEEAIKQARKWFAEYQDKDPVVEVKLVTYGPKDEYDDEPEIGVETIWSTRFGESLKEAEEDEVFEGGIEEGIANKLLDFKLKGVTEDNALDIVRDVVDYYETYYDEGKTQDEIRAKLIAKLPDYGVTNMGFAGRIIDLVIKEYGIDKWDWSEGHPTESLKEATNKDDFVIEDKFIEYMKSQGIKNPIVFDEKGFFLDGVYEKYAQGVADTYLDGDIDYLDGLCNEEQCFSEDEDIYNKINNENESLTEAENLNEMAMQRKDAIILCNGLGKQFIEHFDKIFSEPNAEAVKHWIKEMENWYKSVTSILLKPSSKKLDRTSLNDWFFTVGSEPSTYLKKDGEVEKYDEFCNQLLILDSVEEALKKANIITESLGEGASYKGMAYYEYKDGCHVRETPTCFVALDEHGTTLGDSKTKAGAEGIIDDYLSRNIQELQGNSNKLKEDKSDYIGMADVEFYYIISNGNPRQAIILDASTDQDEIIRMAESSKTYNTVSKYFPDGKGGKEEIVWKR